MHSSFSNRRVAGSEIGHPGDKSARNDRILTATFSGGGVQNVKCSCHAVIIKMSTKLVDFKIKISAINWNEVALKSIFFTYFRILSFEPSLLLHYCK